MVSVDWKDVGRLKDRVKKKLLLGMLCTGVLILCNACQSASKTEMGRPISGIQWERKTVAVDMADRRISYEALQNRLLQEILHQYDEYADANPDYIGWLSLPDTQVNGPVVQSELDGDGYWEYLYKDFYGNDKFAGTLFMDKACSIREPATDNWLIYGHNMRDGSMFGTLKYYRDAAFFQMHPSFTFTTREAVETFEILGVVQSWVSNEPQGQFEYYYFFDAENQKEFDAFVRQVKENSLYETGVEAEYGDQLITLSTCDGWHVEGRLAVIGKRVRTERVEE